MNCCAVLLIEANSEMKYLEGKQTTCQNVQGLRHWYGNNRTLVDNVIVEICESCDYFASPLLVERKQSNLVVTFEKESFCH